MPFAAPAFAAAPAIYTKSGLAIGGIDPVSYFQSDGPIAGASQYRLMWRNAVWQFASARNLAQFELDPYANAPRYGGYCAMTLAQGALAPSDPDAWALYEGRLYLTQTLAARDTWLADPEQHLAKSEAYWPLLTCQ